ncbi:MAG: hypothetical protein AB7O66_09610 [Limisphaerales bacterium]
MASLVRFLFRWSLRFLALALVLTAAVVVFRDAILREWLVFRLRTVTGLETRLDRASLNVQSNRVDFAFENLQIRNSPDFGGSLLIHAPRMRVELDRKALSRREIRVLRANLDVASAAAVRSVDGRTNVFALRDAITRNASWMDVLWAAPPGFSFEGIDRLELTLGTLHLVSLAPPAFHRPIALGVTNEVLHHVRSTDDFHPLLVRILVREITSALSRELRTPAPTPNPPAPPRDGP